MNKFTSLQSLEQRLGYTFQNSALLKQALTHKSAHHQHNERLEFLGDAILNLVIADALYRQFPIAAEGELTRARASLVNKNALSELGFAWSLNEYIELGLGEKKSGGFRRESILADAVEAILGAIYLDAHFERCQQVILQHYASKLAEITPGKQKKDPKTQLQESLQSQHLELPRYDIIGITGEPHEQEFTVCCDVGALGLKATGVGPSRRIAEQEAAQKVLGKMACQKK